MFFDGLGLIISAIRSTIFAIVVAIIEYISSGISSIIESSWRSKLAVIEFLINVIRGRSLNGLVQFARVLGEMDEGGGGGVL